MKISPGSSEVSEAAPLSTVAVLCAGSRASCGLGAGLYPEASPPLDRFCPLTE